MTIDLPATAVDVPLGHERFRPHYHFTPRRNWMNDPNGLVYFEGEYHLFFQYNPEGMDWGNMCWGHAVSPDLLRWTELPVAIPETDQMIFSGSVVVDWHNVSGLGGGGVPPLLAFFTAFNAERSIQSQHMAYSLDRGRSFIHYAANPIIDLDLADFRDPKVFYHAESSAWIMVVVLARDHVVQFYRSQNLRDWVLAGSFGPATSTSGQWECPDLFCLALAGAGTEHWVLKMDVDDGLVDGGSGAQYFVGSFDGHVFSIDAERGSQAGVLVDHGPDFYAAITWSDLPVTQQDPIWIGWQSNHQSGKFYPTDPWRGAMSIPRELFLFEEQGQLRLGQRPLDALASAEVATSDVSRNALRADNPVSLIAGGGSFVQRIILRSNTANETLLTIADDAETLLTLVIADDHSAITFTRHRSSLAPKANFERRSQIQIIPADRTELVIFFDRYLLEIFVNGGRRIYTACIFPDGPTTTKLICGGDAGAIERFQSRSIGTLAHFDR